MGKLSISYIPISEIKPYENNPRKNDKAVEIVKNSIKQFGFKNPIILDKNNEIIAGHTRLEASKQLDYKEIPVIWADDLTPEQVKAFRIMDNKSQEFSDWDIEKLQIEFKDLEEYEFDTDLTGFNTKEINEILDNQSSKYTNKIEVPIYEPSNKKPDINELYNENKTNKLLNKIDLLKIDNKEKEFLKKTAQRFLEFRYDKIADYYAHSNNKVKEIMEKLALVIVDFNKAIEEGFIELSEDLASKYKENIKR